MREMSVTKQRYQAVLGVLSEGMAVIEVASQQGVSRRTVHADGTAPTRARSE
jgi:DNA-binding NarL/FixJ family response regulator